MPLEYIRISEQAKDQLIKLKRITGIQHWNVLCRWAFCLSLAEKHPPTATTLSTDSSVEMSWKVFAGSPNELYWEMLRYKCRMFGLSDTEEELAIQFKLHLHRGIAYLATERHLRSIADLIGKGTAASSIKT
jgi:DNA sulfur modification protein DndE